MLRRRSKVRFEVGCDKLFRINTRYGKSVKLSVPLTRAFKIWDWVRNTSEGFTVERIVERTGEKRSHVEVAISFLRENYLIANYGFLSQKLLPLDQFNLELAKAFHGLSQGAVKYQPR